MPDTAQHVRTPLRATVHEVGVWVGDVHGHYAPSVMVDIAMANGWQPDELDAALIEWHRHPEREQLPEALAAHDPDSLGQMFHEMTLDVEEWFNEHVVPLDGAGEPLASFGWHEGSFYLQTPQWWGQED